MEKRVYDAEAEMLGDMGTRGFVLGACSALGDDSDIVANETADAGLAFRRIIIEESEKTA